MKTLQDYEKEISQATTIEELRKISYEAFRQDLEAINLDPTKKTTFSDKVDDLCARRGFAIGLFG